MSSKIWVVAESAPLDRQIWLPNGGICRSLESERGLPCQVLPAPCLHPPATLLLDRQIRLPRGEIWRSLESERRSSCQALLASCLHLLATLLLDRQIRLPRGGIWRSLESRRRYPCQALPASCLHLPGRAPAGSDDPAVHTSRSFALSRGMIAGSSSR